MQKTAQALYNPLITSRNGKFILAGLTILSVVSITTAENRWVNFYITQRINNSVFSFYNNLSFAGLSLF